MPLKAGTKKIEPTPPPPADGYGGSMAEAIEQAFLGNWKGSMGNQDPPPSNDQMRLMFIAIAQGVIAHLKANPKSFIVEVYNGSDTYQGIVKSIETDPA